jgi:transposase
MDAKHQEMEAEVARLREDNSRLRTKLKELRDALEEQYAANEALQATIDARQATIDAQQATIDKLQAGCKEQRATIDKLQAALEEAQRAAKRQAAPFRKGEPKAEPKTPGRKSGRRHGAHAHRDAPPHIDERYDVPMPDRCPHCGGAHLTETETAAQYQTEIPRRPIYRQFDIHIGCCDDCGQRVQGRHELQTSDALGAAASQLGPDAHAAFVTLNKELGLSHGKCARVFDALLGIPVARATSVRSLAKTAQLAKPAYEQLRIEIRSSPIIVPDETGWRVGGRSAWLHGFATEDATLYDIGDRSSDIAVNLLGVDWPGSLIHDGYCIYDRFQSAYHQQCLGHLQRRCQGLVETAQGAAARLPRQVLELIDEAYAIRRAFRGHRLSGDAMALEGLRLSCELEKLASGRFTCPANRRLAGHLLRHVMQWFWFLIDPRIPATNWLGEQAMRPGVVNRKVWGGNRTWFGADVQKVLTSLARTLYQRGHDALAWFSSLRRRPSGLLLPAPER